MKKAAMFVLVIFLTTISCSWAADEGGQDAQRAAHREEMKKIKQAQRENRAKNPPAPAASNEKSFWQKEGERSGLAESTAGMGSWFKNLVSPVDYLKNQQEQYNARKAGTAVTK